MISGEEAPTIQVPTFTLCTFATAPMTHWVVLELRIHLTLTLIGGGRGVNEARKRDIELGCGEDAP